MMTTHDKIEIQFFSLILWAISFLFVKHSYSHFIIYCYFSEAFWQNFVRVCMQTIIRYLRIKEIKNAIEGRHICVYIWNGIEYTITLINFVAISLCIIHLKIYISIIFLRPFCQKHICIHAFSPFHYTESLSWVWTRERAKIYKIYVCA